MPLFKLIPASAMVAVDLLNNEGKAITGIFKLHVLLLKT